MLECPGLIEAAMCVRFRLLAWTLLGAIIFAIAVVNTASAGPLEDAMAAYRRGDYATAVRLLRPLAERGNADAQRTLGVIYYLGEGVPQNYAEAVRWYRSAANQGDTSAQFQLGEMYYNGKGVPQDKTEAMRWYHTSAENGDVDAQGYLGVFYYNEDPAQAAKWFRRAAKQKDVGSQLFLSNMYYAGSGVPQDYTWSHVWANLAASQFKFGREQAIRSRDRASAQMTPTQIEEAQRLAQVCMETGFRYCGSE